MSNDDYFLYKNQITIDNLDKNLQSFISEVELEVLSLRCGLNHGNGSEQNPLAVDYLCQSFGNNGTVDSIIQLPICSECVVSLHSEYQLLILCINCISSQWVFKPDSKLKYNEDTNIIYLTKCPKCYSPGDEVKKYEV